MVSQCDLFYLKWFCLNFDFASAQILESVAGLFEIRGDVGCAGATG